MGSERRTIKIGAWSIIKVVILGIIIVGLLFLPSIIHLRVEIMNYSETIVIQASGKNYVERGFIVYGPWETDVRLTGSFSGNNLLPILIYGLDSPNYNYWKDGASSDTIYFSVATIAQEFSIPIPSANGQESTWYLVFQNPNTKSIEITYRASINFERSLFGHSYSEWISRIGIVILLFYAIWTIVSKRYEIHLTHQRFPKQYSVIHGNIEDSEMSLPSELVKPPSSGLVNDKSIDSGMLPFLDYVNIDGGRYVCRPLIVKTLEKVTFSIDVEESETIDFYVFDEETFSGWDVSEYASFSASRKTFYALLSSKGSHNVRDWIPPQVGNYIIVFDNFSSPNRKRCKVEIRT